MNLAFDHLSSLKAFLRPCSRPAIPSSPVVNQENVETVSGVGNCWFVCGNVSSPVKLVPANKSVPELGHLADFDSKAADSMPYSEKINIWLANVPWFQVENNLWMLDCYPGIVSSSSSDTIKSTRDQDDKVEHLCQQLTKLAVSQYYFDDQEVARPLSGQSASDSEVFFSEDAHLCGEANSNYACKDIKLEPDI